MESGAYFVIRKKYAFGFLESKVRVDVFRYQGRVRATKSGTSLGMCNVTEFVWSELVRKGYVEISR